MKFTNLNPKNEKETKADIFLWDIFKSHVIYFLTKIVLSISSKSKFLSFTTKMNQKHENEAKLDIFSWDILNLVTFFIGHKTDIYLMRMFISKMNDNSSKGKILSV